MDKKEILEIKRQLSEKNTEIKELKTKLYNLNQKIKNDESIYKKDVSLLEDDLKSKDVIIEELHLMVEQLKTNDKYYKYKIDDLSSKLNGQQTTNKRQQKYIEELESNDKNVCENKIKKLNQQIAIKSNEINRLIESKNKLTVTEDNISDTLIDLNKIMRVDNIKSYYLIKSMYSKYTGLIYRANNKNKKISKEVPKENTETMWGYIEEEENGFCFRDTYSNKYNIDNSDMIRNSHIGIPTKVMITGENSVLVCVSNRLTNNNNILTNKQTKKQTSINTRNKNKYSFKYTTPLKVLIVGSRDKKSIMESISSIGLIPKWFDSYESNLYFLKKEYVESDIVICFKGHSRHYAVEYLSPLKDDKVIIMGYDSKQIMLSRLNTLIHSLMLSEMENKYI